MKIEIRRERLNIDFQDKIAFSNFATKQIILKALTLKQTMKNKVSAFMDRGEIRDRFDIEFLLRKGIDLPEMQPEFWRLFKQKINRLKDVDFKVKLGSTLENDVREYYATRKFAYLEEKLIGVIG